MHWITEYIYLPVTFPLQHGSFNRIYNECSTYRIITNDLYTFVLWIATVAHTNESFETQWTTFSACNAQPTRGTAVSSKGWQCRNLSWVHCLNKTLESLCFQHNGAPSHLHYNVTDYLSGRINGRSKPMDWPPRSPDFTLLNFFFSGYQEVRLYPIDACKSHWT